MMTNAWRAGYEAAERIRFGRADAPKLILFRARRWSDDEGEQSAFMQGFHQQCAERRQKLAEQE